MRVFFARAPLAGVERWKDALPEVAAGRPPDDGGDER